METVGIVASIIQVAEAGLALAQVLYNYCEALSASNGSTRDIAIYIQNTTIVI